MYKFWYDYVKPKYGETAKLSYIDTNSFTAYIKPDNISNNIAEYVETSFDISNSNCCQREKYEKAIGLMEHELGGKIMTKLVGLRAKTNSDLIDDGSEDKKAKGTRSCLEETRHDNKIKYLEKNKINIDTP